MKNKIITILIVLLFSQVVPDFAFASLPEQAPAFPEKVDDSSFDDGYRLFEKKEYRAASPYFLRYLSNHSPGDRDYNWAEFFLGISLKKMGFSHASVDVLAHLVSRKPDPKIVIYCLELFEKTTRSLVYDEERIREVLTGQEYGFVDGEIANFVNFYQGIYDWENGFLEWGNDHFKRIESRSDYYYKYLYQLALFHVYKGEIDTAIDVLKQIPSESGSSEEIGDDARQTLARLYYEKGNYQESVNMYQRINKPMMEQSGNLLERAWSQFRMGNPQKAMGLLHAYSAPIFNKFFTPEYYLLKSFIYIDVCHYNKAVNVVSEFKKYYEESLKVLSHRGKPRDNDLLLMALLTRKEIKRDWNFINLLEEEKRKIGFPDENLSAYLEKIYNLKIQQIVSSLNKKIEKEYEKVADRLLRYEEEAHLMEYEIGLDMYQRVYQFHYEEEAGGEDEINRNRANTVLYPFQGEFWNDELADYKVILPNKCQNMDEWDIFFK